MGMQIRTRNKITQYCFFILSVLLDRLFVIVNKLHNSQHNEYSCTQAEVLRYAQDDSTATTIPTCSAATVHSRSPPSSTGNVGNSIEACGRERGHHARADDDEGG